MSVCDIKHKELIVVSSLKIRERASHFDPRVACTHPKELRVQLFNFMTENDRNSIFTAKYLVFMSTGTTPLC